jgi:uncharacterized membrane protein YeiH
MNLNPTPELLNNLYWLTLIAVIVSSASGVLKAGFRKYDLFGVIMIGITTGLGGGSFRDMLQDQEAFWISDQAFFIASLLSSIAIFVLARKVVIPPKSFLIPDAAGLATFSIAGTLSSLMLGAPWLVASFMGVMTGIMGGVLRDILCNETPVVFQSQLYATISWIGSLFFIALLYLDVEISIAVITTGAFIFIWRMVALKFDMTLPKFRFKS